VSQKQVKNIAIAQILPPRFMLRPVRKHSIEYIELVDSIRDNGLLNSILVRQHPHFNDKYEIIDGLYRYTACQEVGLDEIPCLLYSEELTPEKFLSLQIQCNAVNPETGDYCYAKYLKRIIDIREEIGAPISIMELSRLAGKSSGWVNTRLKLLALNEDIAEAVDNKEITLGKAVILTQVTSKIKQDEFFKVASKYTTREFELLVGEYIEKQRADLDISNNLNYYKAEITPRIHSMDELLIELDNLSEIPQIIIKKGLTNATDIVRITLEWVLNLHEDARKGQVREARYLLSAEDRRKIIRRQNYVESEEIAELRKEQKERLQQKINQKSENY